MAETLTDAGWYQLLTDLDQYEDYCNMGFFGSPNVDFVRATKLYLDKQKEAHFYFKKLQLFQNSMSLEVPVSWTGFHVKNVIVLL